jgi:hypothetical protein
MIWRDKLLLVPNFAGFLGNSANWRSPLLDVFGYDVPALYLYE